MTKRTIDTDRAYTVCNNIKETEKQIRELLIGIIPDYQEVLDNKYYKADMGDESASWAMFLGQPEITRSRSQLMRLFTIKEVLVDKYGYLFEDITHIHNGRLFDIAKYSTSREHADELVSQAQILLPTAWNEVIRKLIGKPTADDGHKHDLVTYKICKICGDKHKETHE